MVPSVGQRTTAADLQPFLDKVVAAGAPGVIARVDTPSQSLSLVSGVANRKGNGVRMTPELQFRVGSSAKSFVATVVLQLVNEGALSLDDPVSRWLPWLPKLIPHSEVITVRQVLGHTSGLFSTTETLEWWQRALRGEIFQPQDLVSIAARQPLNFEPGKNFHYSNTDYVVAGLIIEEITGSSLADQLRTRILQRLRLANTVYPTSKDMPGAHARGYWFIPVVGYLDLTNTMHPSAWWGAGELISNAADLSIFFRTLLGGALLPPELLKEMMTTSVYPDGTDTKFGLGVAREDSQCGSMWGHAGTTPGYWTYRACSSSDGTRSAVLMTNTFYPPTRVMQPVVEASVAVMCQALTGRVPPSDKIDISSLDRIFEDWSRFSDVVRQTHPATLGMSLPDVMEPESSLAGGSSE